MVTTHVGRREREVVGIPSAFTAYADWFFWPFMIVAILQLFSINTIDMYSSGVTLQAIGIPMKRWGCILVDTVVSGVVTGLVVFKGNLYTDLSGFLDYILVWLGAWFAILMVDYFLRRGKYDGAGLAQKIGGLYWRNGGINWKAIVALVVGMFAALMWTDALYYSPSYQGPISNATGGGDLSWLLGMVVAGAIYFVLSFRSVPSEVTEAVAVPAAPVTASCAARGRELASQRRPQPAAGAWKGGGPRGLRTSGPFPWPGCPRHADRASPRASGGGMPSPASRWSVPGTAAPRGWRTRDHRRAASNGNRRLHRNRPTSTGQQRLRHHSVRTRSLSVCTSDSRFLAGEALPTCKSHEVVRC